MTTGINFKVYDAVSQLVATNGGSNGPFLPLAGGILTGDLTVQPASKVIQCQPPSGSCDLTNKNYVDSFKYGSYLFRSSGPLYLNPNETVYALSGGNTFIGPDVWSDTNINCTINSNGVVNITNNLPYTTYFKLSYIVCDMDESLDSGGIVGCSFFDVDSNSFFGISKTLKCLPTTIFNLDNESFVNQVHLVALKAVQPNAQFNFAVSLTNIGPNIVTVDPSLSPNTSHIIVDRVV